VNIEIIILFTLTGNNDSQLSLCSCVKSRSHFEISLGWPVFSTITFKPKVKRCSSSNSHNYIGLTSEKANYTIMQCENFMKQLDEFEVLLIGGEEVTDFEEIYTEYFSDVYKYVLTLCRNESVAEEVTQESFFKVLRNIDNFNGSCNLFVWLCQIAKNTYFSLSKKQKWIVSEVDTDFPDVLSNLEKDYCDKETAKRLHALIHNLNDPYKEVFTLRVF